MRRTIRVLLGTLTTAAAVLLAAPAAHAADPVWSYSNQGSGLCIDDTSAGFRLWNCNGTNPQKWSVHTWNDGTVRFQNVNTGRCMDDSGADFHTAPCSSSVYQSWWVKYWEDGTRRFQNQGTTMCIEGSSILGLRTPSCDSSVWESWYRL
jgi:hypothetical protein